MVLLKSVLTAMPNYAMSCFKLPVSLCKQIQAILTRFWWDVKPDLRKMSWVSWDKLTLPKGAGGLGFKEIEVFNDTLLAKHTWRLLKNPNSLLGQTLLNKYCLEEGIMECSAPNSASHGWREILAGREIIKKGLGWVVGNGKSIRMWQDNWLATSQQSCPIGPPTEQIQLAKVSELMLPNTVTWDTRKIRELLPQYEEQILKLVPSASEMPDERVWLLEKSGEYTTKTGYAVAKINTPNNRDPFNWKQCIWNVKCSPKLQNFLWKLKNDAIAVGASLTRRGIHVDGNCKRCGAPETTLHVMFSCPFAMNVWNLAPLWRVPCVTAGSSMGDLLHQCTRLLTLPPSGLLHPLYLWIMWALWTSRNQLLFEDKSFLETEVILKAIKSAKE